MRCLVGIAISRKKARQSRQCNMAALPLCCLVVVVFTGVVPCKQRLDDYDPSVLMPGYGVFAYRFSCSSHTVGCVPSAVVVQCGQEGEMAASRVKFKVFACCAAKGLAIVQTLLLRLLGLDNY